MYDSFLLSKYIIGKCAREKELISNLKLNRILYLLQITYCKYTNGELLFLDNFRAFPYGPILPDIYNFFKCYGGKPINVYKNIKSFNSKYKVKNFIDNGVDILKTFTPWDFVKISNAPGSPWYITYNNGKGCKDIINNELIIKIHSNK